jgi:hypothetical protein
MSRPVELADVVDRLGEFGALAILVSVTPDGAPHVGTVLVTAGDGRVEVRIGAPPVDR